LKSPTPTKEQKMFDKNKCSQLRQKMTAALKTVEADLGIQIKVGNMSFSGPNVNVKVEASEVSADGTVETPERTRFKEYCELYGFTIDQLDATFTDKGQTWKVVGIKSRAQKFPIVIESPDGRRMKAAVKYVKAMLAWKDHTAKK